MSPEIEAHYKDVQERLPKAQAILDGSHSFVMMMVLGDLIARWILAHPPNEVEGLAAALRATVVDRMRELIEEIETLH